MEIFVHILISFLFYLIKQTYHFKRQNPVKEIAFIVIFHLQLMLLGGRWWNTWLQKMYLYQQGSHKWCKCIKYNYLSFQSLNPTLKDISLEVKQVGNQLHCLVALHVWAHHHNMVREGIICYLLNSPFYSYLLGCQAFEQEWG